MVNPLEEISFLLDRYHEWKEKRDRNICSDCGFFVACKKCSEKYAQIDTELIEREGISYAPRQHYSV